jgi:hypothetical protein
VDRDWIRSAGVRGRAAAATDDAWREVITRINEDGSTRRVPAYYFALTI